MKFIDLLTEVKMYEELGLPASAVQSLDSFVAQELDEADMLGAGTTELPSDELQGYLDRSAGQPAIYKKTGLPKLDKKGRQKYTTTKDPTDKFKFPYVHPKLAREIQIVDPSGRRFDLDKLKTHITTRPDKILKQNEKISHSGGESTQFYNIGLPALQGLGYDEKNQKFVIINTCPGAGACKVMLKKVVMYNICLLTPHKQDNLTFC